MAGFLSAACHRPRGGGDMRSRYAVAAGSTAELGCRGRGLQRDQQHQQTRKPGSECGHEASLWIYFHTVEWETRLHTHRPERVARPLTRPG